MWEVGLGLSAHTLGNVQSEAGVGSQQVCRTLGVEQTFQGSISSHPLRIFFGEGTKLSKITPFSFIFRVFNSYFFSSFSFFFILPSFFLPYFLASLFPSLLPFPLLCLCWLPLYYCSAKMLGNLAVG